MIKMFILYLKIIYRQRFVFLSRNIRRKMMAIPKLIHYVWVGNGEKGKDIKHCMKTWEKHLSGYQIIEWNEHNFDISSNRFVKQAYEKKKWAYVSDYIRAYAILNNGGIYLDTDVLVLDNFDNLLNNRAFVGFENAHYPFTAVFGAEKGHPFVRDMLNYYDDLDFTYDKRDEMAKVNTKTVSDILVKKYHCKVNNHYQMLETGIAVYPDGVLCNPSKDSISIHVFTGTWMDSSKSFKTKLAKEVRSRLTSKHRAAFYDRMIRKGRC
jgi:hypothetical protein